jgi:tetratricopeptide (TPR) repeat protein
VWVLVLAASVAGAQTFEIGGQNPAPAKTKQQPAKKTSKTGAAAPAADAQQGLGWGTSIDVARQSRAAESALKRGDLNGAARFAEQAANAAPQNPKLWFLLGYTTRLTGNLNKSASAYQRGLQSSPNSVDGLSGLAQTYAKMGRFDEAKQLLTKLIAADPKRSNDLAVAGELFLQSGDYPAAIDLLGRAEAIKPASRQELLIASAYVKSKQPEKAKRYLQMAEQRDPNNPETVRAMAGFYRETQDYPKAIAILKKIAGKNADSMAELAYTYELARMQKEAADSYGRAANGAPKNIAYQLSAAQSYVRVNQYKKAEEFLARAAAIDPEHYRLHATKAEIARMEDRKADAITAFRAALERAPEPAPEGPLYTSQLRMNLAELLRDTGDDAGARQQAQMAGAKIQAITVAPALQMDYHRLQASSESMLGDYAAAENDLRQALAIEPANYNLLLQYGQLLWRTNRPKEARAEYAKALATDKDNKFALTSLGYLARELGDAKGAEFYFSELVKSHPEEYSGYLGLGDLYTAQRNFTPALANYDKAWKLNQGNPLVVAGGANAGIESHQFPLAKTWLDRATPEMNEHPFVMRERERYLTWSGNYAESARLGYRVVDKMPKDRDAIVYLGYDLLYLGRFDDLLRLTTRFEPVLPKEPDLPLLAGYVQRKSELLDEAQAAFTRAIERDPKITTAYINRGFVNNDLQDPDLAIQDFNTALKLDAGNGEAHLGLANAYMQLKKPNLVLGNVEAAAKVMGESKSTHLARAGGLRLKLLLPQAEKEYREALKFDPQDYELHVALAQVLFGERKYSDSIQAYQSLLPLTEDPSSIYANMASASARLHRDDDALKYVAAAEKSSPDSAAVLLATGDTLLTLGRSEEAADRFQRALSAPDASRVEVRLEFARTFLQRGKWDDARQQVALAFAESRVGESTPVLPEHLVTAAGIFLGMNDFDLARRYFELARKAGADDRPVTIGLANTYLAQGQYRNADRELATLGPLQDNLADYDYLMAYGTLNRQSRNDRVATFSFAKAKELSIEDDLSERAMLDVSAEEGPMFKSRYSFTSQFQFAPVFEDSTVYMLDAALFGATGNLLPTPRRTLETRAATDYRIHFNSFPTFVGGYEFRNARGQVSYPSASVILNRNTYDTIISGGLEPVLRLGNASFFLHPGVQFILRRDMNTPVELNANLVRPQLYVDSNSLFNWIKLSGFAIWEKANFTQKTQDSRDALASLNFEVGRPWGRTALLTGYQVRDLQFHPIIREFFSTATYVGAQHRFGKDLKIALVGEYIRAWRVQDTTFALAQAMRPAARVDYRINNRWAMNASFAMTRGQGFHAYDNFETGFLVTYTKGLHRSASLGGDEVSVEYPLSFSFGLQQQDFSSFPGAGQKANLVPIVRVNIF